jgi:hypothetical protein
MRVLLLPVNWNANWSETGRDVNVTPLDWDAFLAPNSGNTLFMGFVGNQDHAVWPSAEQRGKDPIAEKPK